MELASIPLDLKRNILSFVQVCEFTNLKKEDFEFIQQFIIHLDLSMEKDGKMFNTISRELENSTFKKAKNIKFLQGIQSLDLKHAKSFTDEDLGLLLNIKNFCLFDSSSSGFYNFESIQHLRLNRCRGINYLGTGMNSLQELKL